jgi:hypothetical protein
MPLGTVRTEEEAPIEEAPVKKSSRKPKVEGTAPATPKVEKVDYKAKVEQLEAKVDQLFGMIAGLKSTPATPIHTPAEIKMIMDEFTQIKGYLRKTNEKYPRATQTEAVANFEQHLMEILQ